jgi:hypothetical protein
MRPVIAALAGSCAVLITIFMCGYAFLSYVVSAVVMLLFGPVFVFGLPRYLLVCCNRAARERVERDFSSMYASASILLMPWLWPRSARRWCGVSVGPFNHRDAAMTPVSDTFLARALGRDFKPETHFWELCIMLRKVLLLLPQLFSSAHVEFEAICILIVIYVAGLAHVAYLPYKSPQLNRLELISLCCAALVLMFGLLFQSASFPSSGGVNTGDVVGALCVFLMCGVLALFVLAAIQTICECSA